MATFTYPISKRVCTMSSSEYLSRICPRARGTPRRSGRCGSRMKQSMSCLPRILACFSGFSSQKWTWPFTTKYFSPSFSYKVISSFLRSARNALLSSTLWILLPRRYARPARSPAVWSLSQTQEEIHLRGCDVLLIWRPVFVFFHRTTPKVPSGVGSGMSELANRALSVGGEHRDHDAYQDVRPGDP